MTEIAKKSSPGALHSSNSYILLHTRHATAVFDGRKASDEKPEIYGVPRFAGSVGQIYKAASADDPWADWWLLRIDEQIDNAKSKLAEFHGEIEKLLPKSKNINISDPESSEPKSRPLDFGTPSYPHRMAYLVVEFDEFCSVVRGMVHHGLIPRARGERYINLGGKPIRAALQSASGYRYQGVTRNDVVANNPKAQKATLLMGEVPEEIFDMKKRSDFAPILRQYDSDQKGIETEKENDMESISDETSKGKVQAA